MSTQDTPQAGAQRGALPGVALIAQTCKHSFDHPAAHTCLLAGSTSQAGNKPAFSSPGAPGGSLFARPAAVSGSQPAASVPSSNGALGHGLATPPGALSSGPGTGVRVSSCACSTQS